MTALVWHSSFASLTGYSGSARAFVLGLDERGVDVRPLFIYGADHDEQVLAGHMHWKLHGGGERRWQLERDGTLYVNAARVPRIVRSQQRTLHHHIALRLTKSGAQAREVALERATSGTPL